MERNFRLQHSTLIEQLKQSMLNKIASGEWAPGMQVPTEQELSEEFGISPGTVRKAMDFLENAKFILRQQGRGTFVLDPAGREVMRQFERFRSEDGATLGQTLEVLTYEEGEATEIESTNLDLRRGKQVRRFTRRRCFRGSPFLYEEIAMPSDLFPAAKDVDNPELWISTTARNCGVLLGDAEEKITVEPSTPTAAHRLGIQNGAVVMRIRGVMLTLDGQPARWRDAFCVTNGIYYSVPLPRRF